MNKGTNLVRSREEIIAASQRFNLLSDIFMSVALNDPAACEYVLRIITGIKDLAVKEVRSQYTISKITSHGARLDILATDSKGKIYNIEVQRSTTIDHARRTRFYGSMIDSECLQKGKEYDELPEVHIIYISETDLWNAGKNIYTVRKFFDGTDVSYNDGMHITYVNAAIDDGTELAKLMAYFKTANPNDSSRGELSKRIHFLKCEEGGQEIMCKITEEFMEAGRQAGLQEGIEEGIFRLIDTLKELNISEHIILEKIQEKFHLTEKVAKVYLKK